MKIFFHPDCDDKELLKAAEEYQQIWDIESKKMLETIEKISGLSFKEKFINALVIEEMSRSHPLTLRASYHNGQKRAVLVHELCHRLIAGNVVINERKRKLDKKKLLALSTERHKLLDLILYDILIDLYGEDFADKNITIESKRQNFYKEAWQWALSFNREQRSELFSKFVAKDKLIKPTKKRHS